MVVALTAFGLGFGPEPIVYAKAIAPVSKKDVQVLASGPIHEAFAEAIVLNPEPGIVAAKALPAIIEEIPPKQKPEGDVQWIPGYWAWDDERNEYLGERGLATTATGSAVDPRLLDPRETRVSMDFRLLDQYGGERDRIPARAA